MRTFAFDFDRSKEILAFPTKRDALNNGNGFLIVQEPADIAKSTIPLDNLVQFYNAHNTTNPIKSFRDRKTAADRLLALAEAKAKIIKSAEQENEMQNAALKKEPSTETRKGRTSSFHGKVIRLAPGITTNPRREGTHGYKSMEIIMKSKVGVIYEDFIRQGGRRQDLAWDLAHGNVVIG